MSTRVIWGLLLSALIAWALVFAAGAAIAWLWRELI